MPKGKLKKLTGERTDILRKIIAGPKTYYDLTGKKRIAANETVEAAFKLFSDMGLIEIKKSGILSRGRKPYGLNLAGLFYCVKNGFLQPEKAHETRREHKIELPKFGDALESCGTSPFVDQSLFNGMDFLLKEFEKNQTKEFYEILRDFGSPTGTKQLKNVAMPLWFFITTIKHFLRMERRNDAFLRQYYNGKTLKLPKGGHIEDFKVFINTWEVVIKNLNLGVAFK